MDIQHAELLQQVDSRSKSNKHRIDKLEEKQDKFDEVIASIKVLATKEENVESDVKEIKNDVKSLTMKPAKKWEGAVEKALYTIIGIVIAYIFSKIGM